MRLLWLRPWNFGTETCVPGHRLALERGGILHRDISSGNILIVDKPRLNQSRGILHDLDYSSMTLEIPTSPTVADDSSNPPKLYHLRLEQDKPLEHASGHKERTVSSMQPTRRQYL